MIVVSPWVTLALILMIGFGLMLLVWGVFRTFPQVTRFAERTFWCPFRERNVTVGFQENAWDDRPIDVDRCSAFAPATAVECDRLCLTLAKLPTVHPS